MERSDAINDYLVSWLIKLPLFPTLWDNYFSYYQKVADSGSSMWCDVFWDEMPAWGSSLGTWWACNGEVVYISQESCSPGGPINTTEKYRQGDTFTVSYWLLFGFCFCCLQDEIPIERLLCDILCYCLEIHLWRRKRQSPKKHKILADFHLQRKFRTSELWFPLEMWFSERWAEYEP